jgi:hypothetical protein
VREQRTRIPYLEVWEESRPFIGHAYRLVHDDTAGVTTVKRGYFWET